MVGLSVDLERKGLNPNGGTPSSAPVSTVYGGDKYYNPNHDLKGVIAKFRGGEVAGGCMQPWWTG